MPTAAAASVAVAPDVTVVPAGCAVIEGGLHDASTVIAAEAAALAPAIDAVRVQV